MFKKVQDKTKFNKLLALCELNDIDGLYYSKTGDAYIKAIKKDFLNTKNINDNPFTVDDILKQPRLVDFNFPGVKEFEYVCKLYAQPMIIKKDAQSKQNEKIIEKDFVSEHAQKLFYSTLGIVYIITCEINNVEHIIKIGTTRASFSERLKSYNCGAISNHIKASTTNIKIMQSFLATRKEFKLYLRDCSDENKSFTWHNKQSIEFASSKALAYEDILIKAFKEQFNAKPLANVQANATNIENLRRII